MSVIWASCVTCGEDRFPIDEAMIERAAKAIRNIAVDYIKVGHEAAAEAMLSVAAESVLRAALEVTE